MSDDSVSSENTYILDAENSAEMARLMQQDRMITEGMGGLFPERDDVSTMHDILDVACGPGGWVLDVAYAYPQANVVGIDISRTMIDYALARAQSQDLGNAHFRLMDALKPLDFPDASFDLVNARFLVGFLPEVMWPKLLQEYVRIARPGGVIRLTEFDEPGTTNSPAFEYWMALTFRATQLAGLPASPDGRHFGIMARLSSFLRDAGCQHIQTRAHMIDFSSWTPAHESMYQNCLVAFKLLQPFLVKMGVTTPEEADRRYRQMLIEMLSEDFAALWSYITAWGQKPR